jgi:hypothetical protein
MLGSNSSAGWGPKLHGGAIEPRLPFQPCAWKRSPNFEPDVHRKLSHLVAKNNALNGVVHIISFTD